MTREIDMTQKNANTIIIQSNGKRQEKKQKLS